MSPSRRPSTSVTTGVGSLKLSSNSATLWGVVESIDVMVAGGTEAGVGELTLAGFCKARALATQVRVVGRPGRWWPAGIDSQPMRPRAQYNDNPEGASRPFDQGRGGFVLGEAEAVDPLDFVSCIAVARIMMPKSVVRLSAGREWMSDETQALCFLAGANSIFIGEALLTAANPELSKDEKLFQRLGLKPMPAHACPSAV